MGERTQHKIQEAKSRHYSSEKGNEIRKHRILLTVSFLGHAQADNKNHNKPKQVKRKTRQVTGRIAVDSDLTGFPLWSVDPVL